MELNIILGILSFPFALAGWLYGWLICQGLLKQLIPPKKIIGLERAVEKWNELTSEERMEVNKLAERRGKTFWVGNPTPKEEEQAMNERVFREGLIHPLPQTKVEETDEG